MIENKGEKILIGSVLVLITALLIWAVIGIGSNPADQLADKAQDSQDLAYPAPEGYVVDPKGVISTETKQRLEEKLTAFEGTAEVAVVVIGSTAPLEIEQWGINLADRWGVGDKDLDNGVIFIVATEDRKTRIEVGQGLEGKITDAEAGRLLDEHVIPHFRDGKWEAGIEAGVEAIINEINN